MKKITKLVMVMGLLFVVGACGSKNKIDQKAIDTFKSSISNMTKYKSADYELKMNVQQDAEKAKIAVNGAFINDGPLQLSMNVSMSASGLSIKDFMSLNIKDDYIYLSSMGQKEKQALNLNEKLGSLNMGIDPETMSDDKALKQMLTSAKIDGNTMHFVFNTDKLNAAVKTDKKSDTASLLDAGGMKYNKVELDATVNKKKMLTSLKLMMKATQDDKPLNVELTFNLKDVNKLEKIEFPKDLDTYQESGADQKKDQSILGDSTKDDLLSDEDLGL